MNFLEFIKKFPGQVICKVLFNAYRDMRAIGSTNQLSILPL